MGVSVKVGGRDGENGGVEEGGGQVGAGRMEVLVKVGGRDGGGWLD